MSQRISQTRVHLGCLWSVAAGWAVICWLWTLFPGKGWTLQDTIMVGLLLVIALYFTIDQWRFGSSTLVVDTPPSPGHALRGRIETPLRSEPASGIKIHLAARDGGRRTQGLIWQTSIDGHPMRGEHGIVVPVEVSIPRELTHDERQRHWTLSIRARVSLGLYIAAFVLEEAAPERHDPA